MKTKLILPLFAISGLLSVTGCVIEHSRGYSRGPAVAASYSYVYYPDEEVYFEPHRHVYYWSDGGTWRSGARVPQNIVLRSHVTINLDSPEPYRHHEEVRAQHPRHKEEEVHDRKRPDHDQQ
jgi:hypothetical protein